MNSKQRQIRRLTRRNALKILGSAIGLPVSILGVRNFASSPMLVQWHGEALGAEASLSLWHPNPRVARQAVIMIGSELRRLESIFSLYQTDSEILRLNKEGKLSLPSREFVEVLDVSAKIYNVSDRAFDPTIQPLWDLYSKHFSAERSNNATLETERIVAACKLVSFAEVEVGSQAINFSRKGMALSLNGIAQGYITDYITDLLRNEGFDNAMVEMGETRALGAAPDGQPFIVNLMNPIQPSLIDRSVSLTNEALSVSGGYGMLFSERGAHHIFDPLTGNSANRLLDVSVIAPSAVIADGLSTAIYVAGEQAAKNIIGSYPSARATLTRVDGSTIQL